MEQEIHTSKRYGKGNTEYHTAFPPHPPLPGTAICADIYHPGPALPRQQCGDGGAEQAQAKGRKALVNRVKAKVTAWRAQIRGDYLALKRKHVALTTKPIFRFVRLIAITVRVSRWMWFHRPALSYGAMNRFVHDRRFALFRRRAVSYASGGQRVITIQRPPLQRVKAGARSTVTRLTNNYFKLKR